MRKLLKQNPLFYVFLFPLIVDVLGTVAGQPKEYWSSHYQVINEAAPVWPLLKIHPLLFILGTLLIWIPFTYFLTKKLKHPLNLWASLSLFAGHTYNSISWLRINQRRWNILPGPDNSAITLSLLPMTVYILTIGYIATISVQYYLKKRK